MKKMILTESDIEPLLTGLKILGTGGGGSPVLGRGILENEFRMKRQISLVDPDDIHDTDFVVSGGIMGSVSVLDKMDINELTARWEERFELCEAMDMMSEYVGRKINYVVPFEVGGLNTPVILSLAARLEISTIDGDSLGRSAPETQMASFLSHGIALTPMPLVDTFGNSIIVAAQEKSTFADEIGRWMVTNGGGMGANAHYPMNGAELKRTVIPRTITGAIRLGQALEFANKHNQDPVCAVMNETGGKKLFIGKVEKLQGENKGGFYITNVWLKGVGDDQGCTAKLVIKNETMALWIDNRLRMVFPDMVFMIDPVKGEGILSTEIAEGEEIILVGTPCHQRLREGLLAPNAAKAFGGERYGYPEINFIPCEKLE